MLAAPPPIVGTFDDGEYRCITVTMGQLTSDLTPDQAILLIHELRQAVRELS